MGHLAAKNIHRRLGEKLDNTSVRMPWSPALRELLAALYSPADAELVVRMPHRPSPLKRIARMLRTDPAELEPRLHELCSKGLVCDIIHKDSSLYMISPFVVGFFEFTMMRTRGELHFKQWAELFQAYMFGDSGFLEANFGNGQQVSVMRALPHEEALSDAARVEILDYEKASALVADADIFAVGLCSCRHEKEHLGERGCSVPMETCTSLGEGARFLIRNGFAREIERAEMLDILARSRDNALTLSTENVKHQAGFICHCCGCCCNLMRGVRELGYPGVLVTSGFIAHIGPDCTGCGKCARACPVNAITMRPVENPDHPESKQKRPVLDAGLCLGCGACALRCGSGALRLESREQRVLHPEDSFERIILQSLERGTLQNLIFDNPNSRTAAFMRALAGAFLRLPPVKKALMADTLRSRFLNTLRKATGS